MEAKRSRVSSASAHGGPIFDSRRFHLFLITFRDDTRACWSSVPPVTTVYDAQHLSSPSEATGMLIIGPTALT